MSTSQSELPFRAKSSLALPVSGFKTSGPGRVENTARPSKCRTVSQSFKKQLGRRQRTCLEVARQAPIP